MHGWIAPEKAILSAESKIGRIERVISRWRRCAAPCGRRDERIIEMKIVSINDAPAVRDTDGILRCELTDLSRIIDNIDTAEGRNDALRAYIYALRDLQHAHDVSIYEKNDAEIDAAQALVAKTFDQLIVAQLALNGSFVR